MLSTKERLLEIATLTIQKSGIHKLTIRDIGLAVGIKSSSVMYHFKTKDILIKEVVKLHNKDFIEFLKQIDMNYNDVYDKFDKIIELFDEQLQCDKLCLFGMLASDCNNLDTDTKEEIKLFFNTFEKYLEKNLLIIKKEKFLASVIISSLEGAMLIDKLQNNNTKLKTIKHWIKTI